MGLFGLGGVKPQKVVDEYAVEVLTSTPFVAGVRQYLQPDAGVRLGMDVVVLHLDGQLSSIGRQPAVDRALRCLHCSRSRRRAAFSTRRWG